MSRARGRIAAVAVVVATVASTDAAQARVQVAVSGNSSEIVKTVPITRETRAEPRVAISLRLPDLRRDQRIWADGEVQVTLTSVDPARNVIGRAYSFSPTVGARLVLAPRRRGTRGLALSDRRSVKCTQRRPNRNHHCVLTFARADWDVTPRPRCFPDGCRVNLVVDAHHPNARDGHVIVVGTDRPDGSIDQDKGRVSAIVESGASQRTAATRRRHARRIPMSEEGGGDHVVSYSLPLPPLRRRDAVEARGVQVTGIDALPYPAWVSGQLILAGSPGATKPDALARRVVSSGGHVTEANGFNCTQGPSGYQTPCRTLKAGAVRIRRTPGRAGDPRRLYLNLVTRSFPKLATASPGDHARILRGGGLRAWIHRP